jgi:hypothetical protein
VVGHHRLGGRCAARAGGGGGAPGRDHQGDRRPAGRRGRRPAAGPGFRGARPQALSRSWSLVAGHWSHVLATLLLALLATGLVGTLLGLLLVPVGSLLEAVTGWSVTDGWLARTLIQAALNALTLLDLLVLWVLLYLDLRARTERLDLDTLRADLAVRQAEREGPDR